MVGMWCAMMPAAAVIATLFLTVSSSSSSSSLTVSSSPSPPLVSVCGDPGMQQREPRVLLEGVHDGRPLMTSAKLACTLHNARSAHISLTMCAHMPAASPHGHLWMYSQALTHSYAVFITMHPHTECIIGRSPPLCRVELLQQVWPSVHHSTSLGGLRWARRRAEGLSVGQRCRAPDGPSKPIELRRVYRAKGAQPGRAVQAGDHSLNIEHGRRGQRRENRRA